MSPMSAETNGTQRGCEAPARTSVIIDAASVDPMHDPWIKLASRERSTFASSWTEYLCLQKGPSNRKLAICFYPALEEEGEYDEDDEDESEQGSPSGAGDLDLPTLPAFCNGEIVAASEDNFLCGTLRPHHEYEAVSLEDEGASAVLKVASRLGWREQTGLETALGDALSGRPARSVIEASLVEAYLATSYCTQANGVAITLKPGERSQELDDLMRAAAQQSATFITAFNPYSRPLSARANAARNRRLELDLRGIASTVLEGYGQGDSEWPAEPSYLALGLSLNQAIHLGRYYRQNALLWAEKDAIPKLILLR